MAGMRLGGIDPSILRELSGVYKPFVKAFKELISNAFDADADGVRIEFAEDFSSVTVSDDGAGMTPFEFRNDFARIGGGNRRWSGDRTRKGRLRIGSKGIGFLALARYCDRLRVESSAKRSFITELKVPSTPCSIDVVAQLGLPIDRTIFDQCVAYGVRRMSGRKAKLSRGSGFVLKKGGRLSIRQNVGAATVEVTVNCKQLGFTAVLDFDRLLRLADNADLEKLEDFAEVEIQSVDRHPRSRGTRIVAEQLKPFVRRELRAERRKGHVRNIGSRSGLEQFVWMLSRCTPVPYAAATSNDTAGLGKLLAIPPRTTLERLELHHGTFKAELRRPLYPFEADAPPLPQDMLVPVDINERGLKAKGFLAGFEGVVFPAEYRGISVRVRGVSIGEPGFLGAELLLTGAHKAALSQISGEINVLRGLDAVDTLNPGRESFYEESDQYKILRRHLVGDGEKVGGHVARAVAAVLRRSQVRSALADALGRAALRRRALDDVSAAITHLVARGEKAGRAIRAMLRSKRSHVNGLATARALQLGPPPKIGGLQVIPAVNLPAPADVDYAREQVRLDTARPEWRWSIVLFDRAFDVVHKQGLPNQSIAELDLKRGKLFINWGHPVKPQLDERGFIRTALAWVLAKEAASRDPDVMMELALHLLSFGSSSDG